MQFLWVIVIARDKSKQHSSSTIARSRRWQRNSNKQSHLVLSWFLSIHWNQREVDRQLQEVSQEQNGSIGMDQAWISWSRRSRLEYSLTLEVWHSGTVVRLKCVYENLLINLRIIDVMAWNSYHSAYLNVCHKEAYDSNKESMDYMKLEFVKNK